MDKGREGKARSDPFFLSGNFLQSEAKGNQKNQVVLFSPVYGFTSLDFFLRVPTLALAGKGNMCDGTSVNTILKEGSSSLTKNRKGLVLFLLAYKCVYVTHRISIVLFSGSGFGSPTKFFSLWIGFWILFRFCHVLTQSSLHSSNALP